MSAAASTTDGTLTAIAIGTDSCPLRDEAPFSMHRRTPAYSISGSSGYRLLSQPTEHGQSHHQSSPLRHGRGMPPYAAWKSYSGAPHRIQGIHQGSRVVSARCSFSSKSACRTIDWISAVRQIISFGNRFCPNHGRYRCRIQVSGDWLPRHTHELVKEFHIRFPRGTIHRSNVPGDDLLSCQ